MPVATPLEPELRGEGHAPRNVHWFGQLGLRLAAATVTLLQRLNPAEAYRPERHYMRDPGPAFRARRRGTAGSVDARTASEEGARPDPGEPAC